MTEKTIGKRIAECRVFFLIASTYIAYYYIEVNQILPTSLYIKAALKVSPILYLINYVINERGSYITNTGSNPFKYTLPALVLCGIGDICLVFQAVNPLYFIAGLFSFLLGHVAYTLSFGLTPLNGNLLIVFMGIVVACGKVLFLNYQEKYWLEVHLAAYLYTPVIFTMLWRAVCRVNWADVSNGKFTKLLGAVGATLFAISDLTLALNKFQFPIPGAHFIVIVLYYLAQIFIVLSIG